VIEVGDAEAAEAGDAEVGEEHGVQQVQARRSSRTTAGKFKSVKFADLVVDIMLSDIFEDVGADDEHLFTMTLHKGLSERGPEALKVALAEIGQIVEKRVWHPVMVRDLTEEQRGGGIIRSSMFLKDKYFARRGHSKNSKLGWCLEATNKTKSSTRACLFRP
jgi:hypothetical protein